MIFSKKNNDANTIHPNKAQSSEQRKNTSFTHSIKAIKNTGMNFFISTYQKFTFMLRHMFDKIKIIDNPVYVKNTTSLPLSVNNPPLANSVNQHLVPTHTEQPQKYSELKISNLSNHSSVKKEACDAERIYLKNQKLINQYPDVPEDKKTEFHSMNTMIFDLLSSPTHIKQEGIFRKSGASTKISNLLVKLTNNPSFSQQALEDNHLTQDELTGAIKALRNKILIKQPNEEHKLKELINKYKESIHQENETKEHVKNMAPNKRDKILRIAKNNADERLPELQELPLHLQICMPLFVKIAMHSKENKMEPENIAIAIGGGLSSNKRTADEENNFNKLSKAKQTTFMMEERALHDYANKLLTTLIDRELKQFE